MFTKSQDVIEVKILSWFGQAFLEWRQKGYQEERAFVNKGVNQGMLKAMKERHFTQGSKTYVTDNR